MSCRQSIYWSTRSVSQPRVGLLLTQYFGSKATTTTIRVSCKSWCMSKITLPPTTNLNNWKSIVTPVCRKLHVDAKKSCWHWHVTDTLSMPWPTLVFKYWCHYSLSLMLDIPVWHCMSWLMHSEITASFSHTTSWVLVPRWRVLKPSWLQLRWGTQRSVAEATLE